MENYIENIKESSNPRFIDIVEVFNKYGEIDGVNRLRDLVLNKKCSWVTKGVKDIKIEVVRLVQSMIIKNAPCVYFNSISVDLGFSVEILDNFEKKSDIIVDVIGFPSGEVMYLNPNEINNLMRSGLLNYKDKYEYKGIEFKEIFYFDDNKYHEIKKKLNPDYIKPSKNNYDIGDFVLCKGEIALNSKKINVDGEVCRIVKKLVDKLYMVQFNNRFSEFLLDYNRAYISEKNIVKKLNINIYKEPELDEHEIDDDYHIKQLFKNKDKIIKKGDEVKLKNKIGALYSINYKEFIDVWFNIDRELGKVVDLKYIDGIMCAQVSNNNSWYKVDNLTKI